MHRRGFLQAIVAGAVSRALTAAIPGDDDQGVSRRIKIALENHAEDMRARTCFKK